jgi:hypothetical protein
MGCFCFGGHFFFPEFGPWCYWTKEEELEALKEEAEFLRRRLAYIERRMEELQKEKE